MAEFGFYVHVPFCAARCDYCAFATWTDRDHLMEPYADACTKEARRAVEEESLAPATSVFFGGGTPSRLRADVLCSILEAVPRAGGAEVTVECNPEDASCEAFATWRAAGVNRVSFGAQSMVDSVLDGLGRRHGRGAVERAVSLAHGAGFASVSVDLIYGGAGESDEDWRESLDAVLSLEEPPTHVSAYALTVEPGTPLAADPRRHPDDDVQAVRYEIADEMLSAAGMRWYEISNWALPGHECRHNVLYWNQGDYRGIGCAAHSHSGRVRWWNVRTPDRYISAVRSGASATAGEEVVDPVSYEFEALALRIRTAQGVPAASVPAELLEESSNGEALVSVEGDTAVLTLRGRLLANEVALRLVPGSAPPPDILRR